MARLAKCNKCYKPKTLNTIALNKKRYELCETCYNAWFDLRDEVVHKAFEKWLKEPS